MQLVSHNYTQFYGWMNQDMNNFQSEKQRKFYVLFAFRTVSADLDNVHMNC